MNCAKHNDVAAQAYCRTCGKGLCAACIRDVQGSIYCEDCLAAKLGQGPQPYAGPSGGAVPPPPGPVPTGSGSPGLAAMLGFIPGVGAMYNGQFMKALAHVVIFVSLIWMSDHISHLFGMFIAFWVFYMVFDAFTTAKAKRDGLPLPDPLGLNRILAQHEPQFTQTMNSAGERVGRGVENAVHSASQGWQATQAAWQQQAQQAQPGGYDAQQAAYQAGNEAQRAAQQPGYDTQQQAAYQAQQAGFYANQQYYNGQNPYYEQPPVPEVPQNRLPAGAFWLIGLGVVFLLSTLDLFHFNVGRLWPLVLIAIGIGMLVRRGKFIR